MCASKTKELADLEIKIFWRNVLKTSYKGPKVTLGGRRSREEVNFEHKYNSNFCGNIFSFSSPNMCIRY